MQAWRSQVGKRRGRRISKQAALLKLGASLMSICSSAPSFTCCSVAALHLQNCVLHIAQLQLLLPPYLAICASVCISGTAPSQLFLGIENSMAAARGDSSVCAVTLYAPYWLDNRTGLGLDFQVCAASAGHAPNMQVQHAVCCLTSVRSQSQQHTRLCVETTDLLRLLAVTAGCAVCGAAAGLPRDLGLQHRHGRRCCFAHWPCTLPHDCLL